jgi:hypothetical protein
LFSIARRVPDHADGSLQLFVFAEPGQRVVWERSWDGVTWEAFESSTVQEDGTAVTETASVSVVPVQFYRVRIDETDSPGTKER